MSRAKQNCRRWPASRSTIRTANNDAPADAAAEDLARVDKRAAGVADLGRELGVADGDEHRHQAGDHVADDDGRPCFFVCLCGCLALRVC
jgi:hypothetical protein